jgi:hypothetical protein
MTPVIRHAGRCARQTASIVASLAGGRRWLARRRSLSIRGYSECLWQETRSTIQMEPTRRLPPMILSPRRAAHLVRWGARTPTRGYRIYENSVLHGDES